MKKIVVHFCMLVIAFQSFGQSKNVNLDSCIAWTKRNYPLIKQNGLMNKLSDVNLRGINESWLPKLSFGSQATYNTEVIKLSLPGVPAIPHDSYLTSLGIEQLIIDGGQVKQQRAIENVSNQLEVQKNEVELYKLIDRVNQIYIGILLAQENNKILAIFRTNLESRRKNLQTASENGMALASSLDEIDAELLKNEQSAFESEENLKALCKNLSILTNVTIDESFTFETNPVGGAQQNSTSNNRPELKLFTLQEELVNERYKLTTKMALPKLSFSIAANYGRPGPNFINQNMRAFGSGSLNLRWNISSLYGLNREKTKYELNKEMIDLQRQAFLMSIETALVGQSAQINSMQTLIQKDNAIIEKRNNITKVAAAQLENGKINVTNYLWQLNEEMSAKLNLKIHEIKLMNAVSNYNTTLGLTNY